MSDITQNAQRRFHDLCCKLDITAVEIMISLTKFSFLPIFVCFLAFILELCVIQLFPVALCCMFLILLPYTLFPLLAPKGTSTKIKLKDFKILQNVLPNLNDLSGLITEYDGHEVLTSVPWSEGNWKLQHMQNIVLLSELEELDHYLNVGIENVVAYVVYVDGQFESFLVNKLMQHVYFINTSPQSNGLKQHPKLQASLTIAFKTYQINDISCATQSGQNSLAQAYINARVFSWGMSKFTTKTDINEFIENVVTHPILCVENANQMYMYIDMFDDFNEKKDSVKDMIRAGIGKRETLTTVEEKISLSGLCKSYKEAFYIKKYYIKLCSNQFLVEIEHLFENSKDPSLLASKLQSIHNLSDLQCEPFYDVRSYKIFKECEKDMDEIQKQIFLEKMLKNCWIIVMNKCEMLQWEHSFIEELLKCIKECFKSNEEFFVKFDIPSQSKSEDALEHLLCKLVMGGQSRVHNSKLSDGRMITLAKGQKIVSGCKNLFSFVDTISALRNIASHLHGVAHSRLFPQNFDQVFSDVMSPAEIAVVEVDGKIRVSYRKSYVFLDKAIDEMRNQLKAFDDASEIKVFAHELLIVNQSFCWHGTNVVIASKEIVLKEGQVYTWDVSGKSALKQEHERASDGKRPGDDGIAGEHGCHGQSGGNVLIITDRMINSENLTIISNGGDGSDGQDGGDGKDGEDGRDGVGLDEEAFKFEFPDPAVYMNMLVIPHRERCFSNAAQMIEKTVYKYDFWNFSHYCELKTSQDNLVKMAMHEGFCRQSYCTHFGTKGTRGTKGRDGGCGGQAGLGGYSGDIQFETFGAGSKNVCGFEEVNREQIQGRDGKQGNNGKGGKGGRNGKKGNDNARVTEYAKRPTHWFHGHLELRFYETWNKQNCYAWCPKNERFARIVRVSPPSYPALAERGSDGKNTKTTSGKKQAQRRRQTAILTRETLEQFRNETRQLSAKQQSLEYSMKTLKAMADDSIASISRSAKRIHRQNLIVPQDRERSTVRNLSIPTFDIVLPRHDTTKETECELTKMQSISGDSAVKDIIESCNENIVSIDNWHNQLKRLSNILESEPMQSRRHVLRTKESGDRDYSGILHLLQTFIECLRLSDLEKCLATDIYECVATIQSTIMIHDPDRKLQVQLYSTIELILEIVLGKQKFILINEIHQLIIKSCTSSLEYSTDKEIMELDSHVRDELMRRLIQSKLGRVVRKFQLVCDMQQLIDSYEMTMNSISQNGDGRFLHELLQSKDVASDYSEYFQLLSMKPKTSSLTGEGDDNGNDKEEGTEIYDDFERLVLLLPKSADVVKNLGFLQTRGIPLLKNVLSGRLVNEGLRITSDTLKWLVSIIIGVEDSSAAHEFTLVFALYKQEAWLQEYILMQMRIILNLSMEEENVAREQLARIRNPRWLLLLSHKLEGFGDENSLSFSVIEEIVEEMQIGEPDDSTLCELKNLPLSEWSSQLQWRREFLVLQSMSIKLTSDEQKLQAAEYLWGLRNRYGDEFIEVLQQRVAENAYVEEDTFLTLLQNFYSNKWHCDSDSLEIIGTIPSDKWSQQLDNQSRKVSKSDRNLDTLFEMITNDSNNSLTKESLEKVQEILSEIHTKETSRSNLFSGSSIVQSTEIGAFECSDIKLWCTCLHSLRAAGIEVVKKNAPEVLAVIQRGIYLKTGCKLRHTQMIAIVLFLLNEKKGMLEQVSTGEGKSLIIVALAIFKILNGSKVDIITSSSVLAKRDADENRKIYELFSATVSHNCSEDEEERKKAYKAAVVYGEIGTFQRDILLDEFYNENIIGDRTSENVIVDEVDSMLLDKGQNVLYLSHDVSGLDSLEQVYIHIWSFVHSKGLVGTTEDEDSVYEGMIDAIFGIFRTNDIEKAWMETCTLTSGELNCIWTTMIERNLMDETGAVLADEDVIKGLDEMDSLGRQSSKPTYVLLNCVKNVLKEAICTGAKIGKDDIQNQWLAMNLFTNEELHGLYQDLIRQNLIDNDGIILDKESIMRNEKVIKCPETLFDRDHLHGGELKDRCGFRGEEKSSTKVKLGNLFRGLVGRASKKGNSKTGLDPQYHTLESKKSDVVACITSALKDSIRRGSTLCVPHYLKSFIRRHLRTWIRNAFKARFLNESEHYIVDVDRSSNYQNSCNIIIMDTDTGTEQYNSQWNQGLHQFLQLKHGCRISSESLKAVFMSNISFFKRYNQNIYGLTGTLGSEGERRLLRNLYHVEYVTVPTFRPTSFFEEEGRVCYSQEMWLDQIAKCVQDVHRSRPVLVICETIKELEIIERALNQTGEVELHVYKHSFEEPDIFTKADAVGKGCIILATNLAGRGTDIKISEETSESGGLFVCLTYLPSNIRVEQQAFGRTARKGQQGSGQMIILKRGTEDNDWPAKVQTNSIVSFINLKARRDIVEKQRIDKIQNEYESKLKVEEGLFKKFERRFTSFREVLKSSKKKKADKIEVSLLLHVLLDKWALWLDTYGDKIDKRDALYHVNEAFDRFLGTIEDATREMKAGNPRYTYIESFANRSKLGKVFIDRKEFEKAEKMFDEVIKTEPKFSEVAHYYKAHCIVKLKNIAKDSRAKASFHDHLHQAKLLMQTRIDELQNSAVIVQTLSESYTKAQSSFMMVDEYKKQKDGVVNLYSIFIRSIDDACGHEITPVIIQDTTQDPLQAYIIHNDLLRKGVLADHRIASDYKEKLEELKDEYALYMKRLKTTLAELQRSPIRSKDLAHVLPNREDFWDSLLNVKILSKEEEYVQIDKKKMKEVRFSTRKSFLQTLAKHELTGVSQGIDQGEQKSTVWLYPELQKQHEEQILIPRSQFEALFGHVNCWEALERANIIQLTKRAVIDESINPDQVHLLYFDDIDDDAFTLIDGVDYEASKDIFQQLIEQNILSRSKTTQLLRRDIQDMHLTYYQHYQTEVINVILMRYQYRLALQDFVSKKWHTFSPRPHISLFDTLINHEIVTPITVTSSVNEESLKRNLEELYGTEETYTGEEYFDDEMFSEASVPYYNYDGCPCVTTKEVQDICELHSVLENVVSIFMCENEICTQESGIYRATCTEENVKQLSLPSGLKHIEFPLKNILLAKILAKQHKDSITTRLISLQSGLYKYDPIDSNLKDLEECLDEDTTFSMCKEIVGFSLNGLDHVISLLEKKWTWQCCLKIAGIIAFGILQCIAGIAVELFTLGAATHVASGLIGEGFGDILFAVECIFTGYCSLKEYAKQKAISVAMTVCTQGLGAWLSRGAKFSNFGYKIGGEALAKMSGKKLIQEAGKRAILKQAAIKLGKKLVESAAIGLANAGIDYAIETAVREQLQFACESSLGELVMNCDTKLEEHKLKELSLKLKHQVGSDRAMSIISKINMKAIESATKSDDLTRQITNVLSYMTKIVSGGFASAGKAFQRSGDKRAATLSRVAQIMTTSLTSIGIAKSMIDLVLFFGDSVFQQIANELKKEIKQNEEDRVCSDEPACSEADEERFMNEVTANLKQVIRQSAGEKIESDFVKPAMHYCANKAIHYAGKAIKAGYRGAKNFLHRQEFEKLQKKYKSCKPSRAEDEFANFDALGDTSISSEYNDKLMKLLSKTRDPNLFANIVREGVPAGIHCTQAVAEILGRPIQIRVHGGDETMTIPDQFVPKGGNIMHGDPLVLDFHVGENGIGHFSTSNQSPGAANSAKFDCLFDAMKEQGVHIDRENIAATIETDSNLRQLVKSGIHEHFIGKGGVGGARRSEHQQRNMEKKRKGLYSQKVSSRQLVDDGLQNHEIMTRAIAAKINWGEQLEGIPKSEFGTSKESYDHTHVHTHVRLDYRYLVFLDDDNNIRGHTGTFRDETGKCVNTTGQAKYHDQLNKEFFNVTKDSNGKTVYTLRRDRTAQEATVHALLTHVELTDINNHIKNVQKGIPKTLTGHDLRDLQQREEFLRGVNRDRYKSLQIAKRLMETAPENLKQDVKARVEKLEKHFVGTSGCLAGDQFPHRIRERIQGVQSMKGLGNISMSAASWQKEISVNKELDPNPIPTKTVRNNPEVRRSVGRQVKKSKQEKYKRSSAN